MQTPARTANPHAANPREARLGPVALVCAALCALGAAAALGWLPRGIVPVAALALFLGPGIWPLLAAATPVVPSWTKLVLLGWLLGPVAALVPWLFLRAGPFEGESGGAPALAVLFVLVAAAQFAARGKKVRLERPGSAALGAWLLGGVLAALVAAFVFQGAAARVSYHGLLHSALVLATERGLPPENPWMAGAPLGYYWVWHAFGALFAHGFQLAPTHALAAINVWAIVPLAPALQMIAAVLWRDRARECAGFLGALFGLGTVSGLVWLLAGCPTGVPTSAMGLFVEMARAVPEGADGMPLFDRRLGYGLSKFGNTNSYPAALALTVGGWLAAAHALRHGARPWPLLCALLHGGAALANPLVGFVGVLATFGAALVAAPARVLLLIAVPVGLALVPAALLTRQASAAFGGETVVFAPSLAAFAGALLPLVLLLPTAALALAVGVRRARTGTPGTRPWLVALFFRQAPPQTAVLVLLGLGALGPLLLHGLIQLPYDNQYKLVRIAALPLGMLAGVGVVELLAQRGFARAAGAALGVALLGLAAANEWRGARAYLAFARVDAPLIERPLEILPTPPATGPGVDIAAAYQFLRRSAGLRARDPVLVLDAFESAGYGFGNPPRSFIAPDNLQGHEAPAFAAIDLWFDRPSQVLDARTRLLDDRRVGAVEILRHRGNFAPETRAALYGLGRPVVVLVGARDRDRVPRIEHKLRSAGFGPLWRQGTAELYVYPLELADPALMAVPEVPTQDDP